MRDMQKTKKQLMQELEETHRKLSDLEMIIQSMKETEKALRGPDTNKGGKVLNVMLNAATIVAHGDESAHSLATHVDITDLKQAQAAIIAERDNLFSALGATRHGVLVTNDAYDLLYVNEVLEEAFGPWKEKKCYEYLSMGHGPCEGCWAVAAGRGKPGRREWHCPKNHRTYEVVATSIQDPTGNRSGFHVIRDITDRKLAEEQLHYQANLLEHVSDAVISTDNDFKIVSWNQAAERMYGWRADEVIGKGFGEVTPVEYPCADKAEVLAEFRRGGFWQGETLQQNKDGDALYVFASVTALLDRDGNPRGAVAVNRNITDRKLAEAALSENEEKFRAIVETSVDVIFQVDLEGRIAYVSPSIESLLGFRRDEIMGQVFSSFLKPSDLEMAAKRFGEILSGGIFNRLELEIPRKGGPLQMIEATPIPWRKNGQIAGIQGTVRDITARKRSEWALKESEVRFRLISENIPVVVYSVLPSQQPIGIFVSSKIAELTGYSGKDLAETPTLFNSMIHPDDREQAWEKIMEHRRKKTALDIEYRIVTPTGQVKWVVNKATVLLDESGETTCVNGFLEDITERKRAEKALRESEERYRVLVENASDFIFMIDENRKILSVNEAGADLFGCRPEEVVGKGVLDVFPQEVAEGYVKSLEKIFVSGEPYSGETLLVVGDHHLWASVNLNPVRDSAGDVVAVMGVTRDITERKRAEEALRNERDFARGLVETAQAIVLVLDPRGKIVSFNPYMEKISGYPLHEVRGKDWFDTFLPERARADVRALFTRAIGEIQTRGNVDPLLTRDGRELLIEWYDKVFKNAKDEVVGLLAIGQDVTERNRIGMELARLASFPERNPNPIIETDPDGRVHYLNPAACRLMPDLQRRGLEHPWLADWHAVVQEARKDPSKLQTREVALGERIYDQTISYIADMERIRAYGTDITDRKRSEDERQTQLEFLQTLIDTIPNPIFYKGIDQRYTGCNRAFEQFLGLPKTEIVGKTVYEVAPRDIADKYFEKDSELLRHPGTQIYEWKVRSSSGEVRSVIFSKATFVGSDGKVVGLLGVIVDITDLKRIQAALQLREELYRSRFENSPIALWEEDLSKIKAYSEALRSKGVHDFRAYFRDHPEEVVTCSDMMTITDANAATLKLFQCSTLEDLERVVRQHASLGASEAFMEILVDVSEGAHSFARECATLTAEGQQRFLSLRWVVAPGSTETLSKVLFSALDITHLIDVETELRTAESQIRTYSEELEKIVEDRTERIRQLERQRSASEAHAGTGRLAARIAHEINNPLAGIKNSFLLVKRAVPKDHPRYEYVTLIEREIDRIALIVRKTFELYRDEKQVLHEVSAVDCIREVLAISESSLRERELSAELNAPDKPITANLPAGFLTQVLLNLLRNAIDASEPHSTITISAYADDGEMVVKVKDEGQGISDENAPHIFEPFFTTKGDAEHGGLGLGLAVSRSMVEAMGGSITFETNPGKGTTFTVCLPTSGGNKEVQDGCKG